MERTKYIMSNLTIISVLKKTKFALDSFYSFHICNFVEVDLTQDFLNTLALYKWLICFIYLLCIHIFFCAWVCLFEDESAIVQSFLMKFVLYFVYAGLRSLLKSFALFFSDLLISYRGDCQKNHCCAQYLSCWHSTIRTQPVWIP